MQTTKLKLLFRVVPLNNCVRTVTAAIAADIKSDTNLKSWKEIPGPSSLPIIGQHHHFMPGGGLYDYKGAERTMKLYKMYGPIVRIEGMFGKPPMVLLFDPESCATVFRNENVLPVRPGFESLAYYRKNYKRSKGHNVQTTSVITESGDAWKVLRSKVNPIMLQPKTIILYRTELDEVARDMVARLKAKRYEKNVIRNDFDKEMNLWALESIGTVALGCRLNCFDLNLPADSPEYELIQCVHELFKTTYELDFKPSLSRYFSTPYFKKSMKLYERMDNLTKYFLKKGKDQLKNKTDTKKGVLEKLLEIDETLAHVMVYDFLFAGVDTVAVTVTATLYFLAANPEKQHKLREEILSKSERRPYLKACIKESMRVMPAATEGLRITTKEHNLLGYKIPKNVQVTFAHQNMAQFEENFPKPKEYIPERWLANKDDPLYYGNAHPFIQLPFGFGTRSCIGRRVAELEIETFMARLIENFKVEWVGPPPKTFHATVNYIKPPFNFIFNDIAH